jgi:hypothetical protein
MVLAPSSAWILLADAAALFRATTRCSKGLTVTWTSDMPSILRG